MIITVSGNLGSGKSTVAKEVAKRLNFNHYSTGDLMRSMAQERGMTLMELSNSAIKDFSVDRELDDRQKNLGKKEDDFVIDARLGFHFIPQSIKIFLKVNKKEAARRIFNHTHPDRSREADNSSIKKTYINIKKRRELERIRYEALYGIDYEDTSNYDLVIDTTSIPAELVTQKIIDFVTKKSENVQKSSKS